MKTLKKVKFLVKKWTPREKILASAMLACHLFSEFHNLGAFVLMNVIISIYIRSESINA